MFCILNPRFEDDLSVTIPYWDSSLDSLMPSPEDSALWTSEFWGNIKGAVTKGPHKNFPLIDNCKSDTSVTLKRKPGKSSSLFTKDKIDKTLAIGSYKELMSVPKKKKWSQFESYHGDVHNWVCILGVLFLLMVLHF